MPNADLNLKTLDGALSGLSDEEALLAGDVMTTGFYGAALADLSPETVVVVLGGGPVDSSVRSPAGVWARAA